MRDVTPSHHKVSSSNSAAADKRNDIVNISQPWNMAPLRRKIPCCCLSFEPFSVWVLQSINWDLLSKASPQDPQHKAEPLHSIRSHRRSAREGRETDGIFLESYLRSHSQAKSFLSFTDVCVKKEQNTHDNDKKTKTTSLSLCQLGQLCHFHLISARRSRIPQIVGVIG